MMIVKLSHLTKTSTVLSTNSSNLETLILDQLFQPVSDDKITVFVHFPNITLKQEKLKFVLKVSII